MYRLLKAIPIAALASFLAASAFAGDLLPIKFTLDWKTQGVHAWFYLAKENGYFKDEGLDVQIDQGEGSAATVTRVISGAYDAGFGDVNAIVQAAGTAGISPPVMVYMIYNKAPLALFTKANSGITSIAAMSGKRLGSPAGAAALRLFPVLAKTNGIDPGSVEIVNMAPNLIEQMLVNNQVDISAGLTVTSYINLFAEGQNPDKDYRWFFYSDYGLPLYSNGVMVSRALVRDHPDAVAGLVRAVNRALKEVVADRQKAIDLLLRLEPLLNAAIERRRLDYAINELIATPEEAQIGLGDMTDARLHTAISTIVDAYQLKSTPDTSDIFDRSFLPARVDRRLPAE
jgi:NitT/TauT family transport system substrate-binding protein